MTSKAAYVQTQGQTRAHHCHWPGCDRQVPPAMWGCKPHWFALPEELRTRIWQTFVPGQEVRGAPSVAYVAAAREVQTWIAEHQAARQAPGRPLVTLIDGRQVSDYSEAWRHECEARYVARLPLDQASSFLAGVRKRRGDAAGQALEQLAAQIYQLHGLSV